MELFRRKLDYENSQNEGNKNYISNIPKEIQKLKHLKKLILAGEFSHRWQINCFLYLNELDNLETLDLSFTQLSSLDGMPHLMGLQSLYLRASQLKNLDGMLKLQALKTLDLWIYQSFRGKEDILSK